MVHDMIQLEWVTVSDAFTEWLILLSEHAFEELLDAAGHGPR